MKVAILLIAVLIAALAFVAFANESNVEDVNAQFNEQGLEELEDSSDVEKMGNCGKGLTGGQCHVAARRYCGGPKCCNKLLFGVDTNEASSLAQWALLRKNSVHFVVRYISWQATGPMLPAEAKGWRQAHIKNVAVYEMGRLRPVEGGSAKANFANGRLDARRARAQMKKLGANKAPIYFAIDTFVNPKNPSKLPKGTVIKSFNSILPYVKGIRSVLPHKRVGVYGSFTTIKGLFDRKLIAFGWQASSFDSGTRLDMRAQLYQCSTLPPDHFNIGQLDYNFALRKNYGQWTSTLKK